MVKELEVGDTIAYKEFFRMTKDQFAFLVGKVYPLSQKKTATAYQCFPSNRINYRFVQGEFLSVRKFLVKYFNFAFKPIRNIALKLVAKQDVG